MIIPLRAAPSQNRKRARTCAPLWMCLREYRGNGKSGRRRMVLAPSSREVWLEGRHLQIAAVRVSPANPCQALRGAVDRPQIGGSDGREYEVLSRHGAACEASQHGQLADMGHGIGKGTRQQNFSRDAVKIRSPCKAPRDIGERSRKMGSGGREVRQQRRAGRCRR